MSNEGFLRSSQVEALGGFAAGFATTLVTHPLELIKIRLQLYNNASKSESSPLIEVLSQVRASATKDFFCYKGHNKLFKKFVFPHLLREYYRGITPNLLGNLTGWSLYFTIYAEFKKVIHFRNNTLNYFTSSTFAGITCSLLTNPIWVLKTRIVSTSSNDSLAYKSIIDGVAQIFRNEGIYAFWKGTIPSLFSVFQASLQITLYDKIKGHLVQKRKERTRLTTFEFIYTSAASKIVSSTVMYPAQVIKARLQALNPNHEKRTLILVTKEIWEKEGKLRGFYRGISANLIRVVPATCVTFVTYEIVKKNLESL